MNHKPNPADFTHNGVLQQPHYDNAVKAWEKRGSMGEVEKSEGKEYIITFPISEQITEYEWVKRHPTMKVTNDTTVGQIAAFFRKYNKVGFVELKLIQIQ
jgi:hypothetical protein